MMQEAGHDNQIPVIVGQLIFDDLPHEYGMCTADTFFRTSADMHGSRSIATVLSGLDGDGTIGIKWIKEKGGLTGWST
ncbi:MAG: hypothetical protein JO066_05270 [Verrucomicrobia bacterium]|nr:hypothetical protein [Verrucomicrobiota bacterium]